MTEETASEQPSTAHHGEPGVPSPGGHTSLFRSLFVTLIEAARTRLDLATVEAEIFLARTMQLLLWALAALACGLLALAFFIVALVAALWDTHRMLGVLSGAGLFVLLAAIFAYVATRTFKGRPGILDGTLSQLGTDAERVSGKP